MDDELAAAQRLKKYTASHPTNGLGFYWTSFTYSQYAQGSQISPKSKLAYYDTALLYYKRAEEILIKDTENTPSLMALKSLIHGLQGLLELRQGNQLEAADHLSQKLSALNEGLEADNSNPLLYVQLGIGLIQDGFSTKAKPDLSKLIQGKLLLEKAKELYSSLKLKDQTIPNRWNETWIDTWLARLKK